MSSIACYALSAQGVSLAHSLAKHIDLCIYAPEKFCTEGDSGFTSLSDLLAHTFNLYKAHIFISATGIAVRSVATHLMHKSKDPAVVVCDELGHYAISLLSGHWGGANELCKDIAKYLAPTHSTKAIITTATDINNVLAIDMLAKQHGCIILDWNKVKFINSALLNKEAVQLYDPRGIFNQNVLIQAGFNIHNSLNTMDFNLPSIGIDWQILPEYAQFLRLTMPVLCVGIGCKRGTHKEEILCAIEQTFAKEKLEPRALSCFASADIKSDEAGLILAAKEFALPLRLFNAHDLANTLSPNPSAIAAKLLSVEKISVSEGAALLGAGDGASLIVPKVKYNKKITVAIALSSVYTPNQLEF